MKNTFLFKERATYFQNWDANQFCVGDKTLSGSLLKAKKIQWPGKPKTSDYTNIIYLRLKPTKAQAKTDEFPDYIVELTKIKQLDIPVPLLEKIDAKKNIPKHLETLIITANDIYISKNSRYPAFASSGLEQLKGLVLDTDPKLNLTFDENAISSVSFKKLAYINTGLDKEGVILNCIQNFKTLDFIEVNNVASQSVFEYIPAQARYVYLSEMAKEFSFEKIGACKNIEYLSIAYSLAEIDCNLFTELPNLKELIIRTSKKLANVSALLECKKLTSLTVMDCNNPFKKIDKKKFEEKFTEILNIDIA